MRLGDNAGPDDGKAYLDFTLNAVGNTEQHSIRTW